MYGGVVLLVHSLFQSERAGRGRTINAGHKDSLQVEEGKETCLEGVLLLVQSERGQEEGRYN